MGVKVEFSKSIIFSGDRRSEIEVRMRKRMRSWFLSLQLRGIREARYNRYIYLYIKKEIRWYEAMAKYIEKPFLCKQQKEKETYRYTGICTFECVDQRLEATISEIGPDGSHPFRVLDEQKRRGNILGRHCGR